VRTMFLLEIFKTKRRRFFLPIILFAMVGILWSLGIANKEISSNESNRNILVLINGLVLINSMIYPLLIGILCSRLLELEHHEKIFGLLHINNQGLGKLFIVKSLLAFSIVFILGIFQVLYLLIMAKRNHVETQLSYLLLFILSYVVASIFLIVFQLAISLLVEKQSVGIVLSLAGAFIGLVSGGMIPNVIQLFLPWQYFAMLNPVSRKMVSTGYHYTINQRCFPLMIVVILMMIIELVVIRKRIEEMEFC